VRQHFSAPWSTSLKLITAAVLVFLLSAAIYSDTVGAVAILGVVALCAAFAVRGYSVADGKLMIHRLGWSKSFDLSKLSSVEVRPGATSGSIRTWGIGGLFGFIGFFRNRSLGFYRSYVTDSENAVVLDFDGKKIVVTPGSPAEFAEAVQRERS
jgi:hypothetical protein